MGTEYNGGVQLITQPTFFRDIDVTAASFDGTDTANVDDDLKTQETNGSKFNPWKKNGGFLIKPTASGLIDVLSWEDYKRNGKVVDDTLMQTIQGTGGAWNEERVVKVYTTSVIKTMQIGTVL